MKAVILSGGIGKRLKPLTDYLPKPLVPIEGVPIIEWQIRYFKKFGIKEFVVCAGYLSKQLVNFLESKDFGAKFQFSIEKTPLGTAGAIKKAEKYLRGDSFFVTNGDIITNIDLLKLKEHKNSIAVIPLRTSFGIVNVNSNNVERFEEKPEIFNYWMNAGIYYLNSDIIKNLPKQGNMETSVFPMFAEKRKLHATKYTKVFWNSIDSFKDLEDCVFNMKKYHYADFVSK